MLNTVLLQAGKAAGYGQLVMILAIFVVMYFFMIRPQQKKAKEQKKYLEGLKVGDKVVTIGGLHGRISSMDEATMTLEVDRATKLTFDRAAVSMDSTKRASADLAKS